MSDVEEEPPSKKPPKVSGLNIHKICLSGSSDKIWPEKRLPGPQAPRSRGEIFGAPSSLRHSYDVSKPTSLLKYRHGNLGLEALAQTSNCLFSNENSEFDHRTQIPKIPKKSFKKKTLKKKGEKM